MRKKERNSDFITKNTFPKQSLWIYFQRFHIIYARFPLLFHKIKLGYNTFECN